MPLGEPLGFTEPLLKNTGLVCLGTKYFLDD